MLKVLLPVDGSTSAQNAINKALDSGVVNNAEMHVMTVIAPPNFSPSKNPYIAADMVNSLAKANREMAEKVVEEAKDQVCSHSLACAAHIIREGDAAEEILKYAEEMDADLIVMGNRGLSTFNKILLGSVSQKVLNNSHCSVLIVKERK